MTIFKFRKVLENLKIKFKDFVRIKKNKKMLWTVITIPKRYVRQMTKKTPIAPNLFQKINNLLNKNVQHNLYDYQYFSKISKMKKQN